MRTDDFEEDRTLLAGGDRGAGLAEAVTHVLSFSAGHVGPQRVTVGHAPLLVGRSRPADLVIESSKVSRQHCRFQVANGVLMVADLGSTNGTFVDGRRIFEPTRLQHGASITVGAEILAYERLTARDLEVARASEQDLRSASAYVQMLLPEPLLAGCVRANWLFLPCSQLGGSGFGYRYVRPGLFAGFLVEVAGTGTRAAMHAVALMNFLRQPDVSGVDLADCVSVLEGRARAFPSEQNGGLFFSACYFTFETESATLSYAAAGRAPALLADAARRTVLTLDSEGGPIGLRVDDAFVSATVTVAPGSRLFLLGSGAFELLQFGEVAVGDLVLRPDESAAAAPLRLHQAVLDASGETPFDEDFVALVFSFDGNLWPGDSRPK